MHTCWVDENNAEELSVPGIIQARITEKNLEKNTPLSTGWMLLINADGKNTYPAVYMKNLL